MAVRVFVTHKAQSLGYLPEVILAGRRINDGMGKYVATEVVKLMIKKEQKIANAKILQLGIRNISWRQSRGNALSSRYLPTIRNAGYKYFRKAVPAPI